jgi:hypothetical protein
MKGRPTPILTTWVARAALTALALAPPPPALAQTKGFVARPRPLPEARSFLVSEVGVMIQLVGENVAPGDDALQGVTDQGVMFNASERLGVGLVLHGEAGGSRSRLGPAIRVRRWIGRQSSVDIQAGAMLWGGEDNGVDFTGPSPHAQITINGNDVIALQAQAQLHAVHLRGDYPHVGGQPPTGIDEDHNELVMHAGVRLGTVPGVFASVILGALAALYVLSPGPS